MSGYRISEEEVSEFERLGFTYLKNYVPMETLNEIRESISRWVKNYGSGLELGDFVASSDPTEFDLGLVSLRQSSPGDAGRVYDAIKKMPPFMQWAADQRHVETARRLFRGGDVGIASRGWGMRIDYPNDQKHATQLHQDFVSQLCGPKGIVIWAPLRDVTLEMGPVIIYPGSHLEGVFPIENRGDSSQDIVINDESLVRGRFASKAPTVKAGDAVVMDFMLLHESGQNKSEIPRWSMLTRFFDAADSKSIQIGWRGGLQEGNVFSGDLFSRRS